MALNILNFSIQFKDVVPVFPGGEMQNKQRLWSEIQYSFSDQSLTIDSHL
jgi:hypothetical protein